MENKTNSVLFVTACAGFTYGFLQYLKSNKNKNNISCKEQLLNAPLSSAFFGSCDGSLYSFGASILFSFVPYPFNFCIPPLLTASCAKTLYDII